MLLNFARFVVRRRRAIVAVYVLLFLFGAFGMINSRINYDMLSYLPDELDSVKGFSVVDEQFGLGNTAQILIYGESDPGVQALVERLREIEGVKAVNWASDMGPITEPVEFRDEVIAENYYAEGATIVQVSFDESGNTPLVKSAVSEIREAIEGYDAHLTGAQQLELEEVMDRDQVRFAVAALALVTIVLLLTLPSIVVPVVFVLAILTAVVVNLGLSYYIGQEVSYITGVIVFALQFAVTMDYALFLYHRFTEERTPGNEEEAMAVAVASTFKSILAAAVTTIAGFLALVVMKLGFGLDMGVTLARGVLITLVAIITLLPGLLLFALPLIDRISHRVPRFDFSRLGHFIGRHAGAVMLIGMVLFVPAIWGYSHVTLTYDLNSSLPDDLPSTLAAERVADAFGRAETVFIVLEDSGTTPDLERLYDRLGEVDGVTRVFGYGSLVDPRIPVEFIPAEAREAFYAEGYTYVTLDVAFDMKDPELSPMLDDIRAVAADEWPGVTHVTGQPVLMDDMERVSQGDAERINLISIVAIFLIVAIAFKSITLPAVLLAVIQLAILLNQSFEAFSSGDLIFVASLAIGAIQLGATVDYAILITTRYEEELTRTRDRVEAITVAVGESSQSILVSAATMFAATIALAVMSSVGIISSLTMLIARGAIVSFFVVIVFLPAVLVVGQPIFERTSLGWPRHTKKGE
ncbi:MAG: MMPL family transporter [Coriobacteriia bacterium]|nr:MMPL family transporter [Coriobacteriia bacterium]